MNRFFVFFFFLWSAVEGAAALESFDSYFKNSKLGPVQTRESEHFKVSWVNPRDELLVDTLLTHMELADKELSPIFRDSSGSRKRTPIEIYPDLKSFADVSKLSLARFKATGTIALTLDQRLMLLSPRNLLGGYSWVSTATHEYIHYLIREISPDHIPIWLHEGVAQLFQEYPYDKNVNLKPMQWGLFKKTKKQNKWLSLQTLQEPFPYRKDPEEAELAYIEALLFARWLDQKCGVLKLIRETGATKSIEKGLAKCTGLSAEALSKKFQSEILGGVAIPEGSDVEFFARDFSESDPMNVEGRKADRKARNFAQLSTELFKQGRYRPAGLEMEKALAHTPVAPPSWRRQLAVSYLKSKDEKKAEEVLSRLVRDYPEDAAAWYLLGEQKMQKKSADGWQDFLKAFYVNPFLEGLTEVMQLLKEKNPAFKYTFF